MRKLLNSVGDIDLFFNILLQSGQKQHNPIIKNIKKSNWAFLISQAGDNLVHIYKWFHTITYFPLHSGHQPFGAFIF